MWAYFIKMLYKKPSLKDKLYGKAETPKKIETPKKGRVKNKKEK